MNGPGLQFDPHPNLTPPPHSVILSSKFPGICDFYFAAKCKVFWERGKDEQNIYGLFMFPPERRKKWGKTSPLIPREDNGGGQRWSITGGEGEPGSYNEGGGDVFSLGSLLFAHKKGNCY